MKKRQRKAQKEKKRGREPSKCVREATKLLRTKTKGGNRDSDETCMRMPKK